MAQTVGRNDRCPCGSGKKYKACCGRAASPQQQQPGATSTAIPDPESPALAEAIRFHERGDLRQAQILYEQILARRPNHPDATHLLGVVAAQSGRPEVAADLISRAAVARPDSPDIHNNLGNVLHSMARYREAAEHFERAVALNPQFATAHGNLGAARMELGRVDAAIESLRRAIALQPGVAEFHSNLGNALKAKGELADSQTECERAIRLKPTLADAHNNLGNTLREIGRLAAATESYREAIRLNPNSAQAFANLGTALTDQGLTAEGVEAYRQALRLRPDDAGVHGRLLLALHYLADVDPQDIYAEHREWERRHAMSLAPPAPATTSSKSSSINDAERRLRIGYVSSDFREHSVAYFAEGLIANHDPEKFEVFCYASVPSPDEVTARFKSYAAVWRSVDSVNDAELADMIRADAIDVLVDLNGHTGGNRLLTFARKAAPVQISCIGYWNTTGLGAVDYYLTDSYADPVGATDPLYAEKLLRLPDTFACFSPARLAPEVGPLPADANGYVTFASFHTLAKLNEPLLERWCEILRRTPGSRLMFVAAGRDESVTRERVFNVFSTRGGVDPARLEMIPRQSASRFLELHQRVDVALDAFPFSGHTTGCHAMWMGVPVVTRAGATHYSRMVASALINVGLPELVAESNESYVDVACRLAADLPHLRRLRVELRERMRNSPLTDAKRYCRHVEDAYRRAWRETCR